LEIPQGSIIILVMAEEKWEEADFLRSRINSLGCRGIILDMGLTGEPAGPCDIGRAEVIAAGGIRQADEEAVKDRGQRMPIMIGGGRNKVKELYLKGSLSGVISLGGTTGTQMGAAIMKALPFGVPKLAVSSTASLKGFASRYLGTSDVTLMHTVVEIAGLNRFMRNALSRAAGAICAMKQGTEMEPLDSEGMAVRTMIAMTHFGPCEECATAVRSGLEKLGHEVVGFSAAGIGDRAMEEIIESGSPFSAVIDLATGGVGEELLGFSRAAGPSRLEAAGKKGIPQVVSLSGVNFGSPWKYKYKPEYESRKKYRYDSARTFIRLSEEELYGVAAKMAEKLNSSKGPVKVLVPLGGWSSVDKRGSVFYDKKLDSIFAWELKKALREDIGVIEVDADLESPLFSAAVVDSLVDMI